MTTTHVGDLGVGALGVVRIIAALLLRIAQLLVHAGLLLSTPHTSVGHVGALAEAAVLPAHRAVVQGDCGGGGGGRRHNRANFCLLTNAAIPVEFINNWSQKSCLNYDFLSDPQRHHSWWIRRSKTNSGAELIYLASSLWKRKYETAFSDIQIHTNVCVFKSVYTQLNYTTVEGWWWLSAEAEADAKDEAKLMEPSASHVKSLKKIKKNKIKTTCRSQIRLQLPGERGSRGSAARNVCCLWLKKVHRIGINRTRTFQCWINYLLCCVVFSAATLFFYFKKSNNQATWISGVFCFILWLRWARFQVHEYFFLFHMTLKVAAFDLTKALLWDQKCPHRALA